MGTWGSGIYDNDGALDGLASLLRVPVDEPDAARVVASIGLIAWLMPVTLAVEPEAIHAAVAGISSDLGSLPEATRDALAALLADLQKASEQSARTPAVAAAIGHASCGPYLEPLLRFPGAAPVIAELAERAALRLDDALGGDEDLYEIAGDLGALGVLIELRTAGLWQPDPARLAAWHAGLIAADEVTDEERGFWDRYVARARPGLDLLA